MKTFTEYPLYFAVVACGGLIFAALLFIGSTAHAGQGYSAEASAGYETRYIGTGRGNALAQGGHFVFTAAITADNGLGVDLWQSYASTVNYQETNWTITYSQENDLFGYGAGYRWLYFDDGDNSSDHEVLAHISATWMAANPTLSYLYSTTANGFILNLSGEESFDFAGGKLSLGGGIGWEKKYTTQEKDGFNHVEFHLGWSRPISSILAFSIYLKTVNALENLDRADSGDWVWGGFAITASY